MVSPKNEVYNWLAHWFAVILVASHFIVTAYHIGEGLPQFAHFCVSLHAQLPMTTRLVLMLGTAGYLVIGSVICLAIIGSARMANSSIIMARVLGIGAIGGFLGLQTVYLIGFLSPVMEIDWGLS